MADRQIFETEPVEDKRRIKLKDVAQELQKLQARVNMYFFLGFNKINHKITFFIKMNIN